MTNPILRLREAAGLSQAELARRIGTSRAQMGRLERDEREVTKRWANRIAPHVNCTPSDILFPSDSSKYEDVSSGDQGVPPALPLLKESPALQIVMIASEMAGNEQRAQIWYEHQPLPGWAGKTASDLVREGKADIVFAYLQSVRAGVYA